jgi:hypothetical protein
VLEKAARKQEEKQRQVEEEERFEAKLRREREQLTVEFLERNATPGSGEPDTGRATEKGMTNFIQEMERPNGAKVPALQLRPAKRSPVSLRMPNGAANLGATTQLRMVSEHAEYSEQAELSDRNWDNHNDNVRTSQGHTLYMPRSKVIEGSPAAKNYMSMLHMMEGLPKEAPEPYQAPELYDEAPPLLTNQVSPCARRLL